MLNKSIYAYMYIPERNDKWLMPISAGHVTVMSLSLEYSVLHKNPKQKHEVGREIVTKARRKCGERLNDCSHLDKIEAQHLLSLNSWAVCMIRSIATVSTPATMALCINIDLHTRVEIYNTNH